MARVYYRAAIVEHVRADLKRLALYCQEPDQKAKGATDLATAMKQFTHWPTIDLLKSIEFDVTRLAGFERKKPTRPPLWEPFQRVNRRISSLRLVWRVNNLVERAKSRLTDAGQSALEKLWQEQTKDAQGLLHDIERVRENLSAARTIDWAQHERVLSKFSHAKSVELACGKSTASPEVRCYARVLELIVDHEKHEPLRKKSEPLVRWLAQIEHPMAKDLEAFNHEAASAEEDGRRLGHLIRTRHKREGARERDRRYRQRKNSLPKKRRSVTR
jgi:hypothetical protein